MMIWLAAPQDASLAAAAVKEEEPLEIFLASPIYTEQVMLMVCVTQT